MKNWMRALALLILLPLAACGSDDKPIYTAVIDAGSSGTRMFLYKVTPAAYPVVEKLVELEFDKQEDGINDFINSAGGPKLNLGPNDVGPWVIGPLLDGIKPKLAELGIRTSDVQVDLLATAGMRNELAPTGKHTQAEIDAFYAIIRSYIGAQGFNAGEARTSDGNSEEGKWTWVNLNDRYYNVFTSNNSPVGVVEVGGASTQISYPTSAAPSDNANIYRVSINGKTFNVFNRTYLGLGQDDARKAMRLENPPNDGGVRCFPTDLAATGDAGDAIDGVTVKIASTAAYNYSTCSASFDAVVNAKFAQLGNPNVANSSGSFVGIDGAYYALQYWNLDAAPTRAEFSAKIQDQCASVANFTDIAKAKYVQRQCASATYINALLYGGSGLFSATPDKFARTLKSKAVDAAGSVDTVLTWTRGYLMLKYAQP